MEVEVLLRSRERKFKQNTEGNRGRERNVKGGERRCRNCRGVKGGTGATPKK